MGDLLFKADLALLRVANTKQSGREAVAERQAGRHGDCHVKEEYGNKKNTHAWNRMAITCDHRAAVGLIPGCGVGAGAGWGLMQG